MTLLSTELRHTNRKVRGREKRNLTLNTKLTKTEFAEVEQFCESRKIAFCEWVREVVLREVRNPTDTNSTLPLLTEITGLRLLLVNGLEPLLRGEKMSPDSSKRCFGT